MRAALFSTIVGASLAGILLVAGQRGEARPQSQPVVLTTGCNLKAFIPAYCPGSPLSLVTNDIAGGTPRLWFQVGSTSDFALYDPRSEERSQVTTLQGEAGFICVDGETTWNRPAASQCGAEQPPPPPGGGEVRVTTADLALTDLFPTNLPQGDIRVRITNNGPDNIDNIDVQLSCSANVHPYSGGIPFGRGSEFPITVSLSPGQTADFGTGVSVDTTTAWSEVTCTYTPNFNDPDASNNSYTETFPPPP